MRQLVSVAEQIIKKVAFDIQANLVRAASQGGTPVDTGWARANWLVNVGTPFLSPIGEYTGRKTTVAPNTGLASIATYKLGPKVFISNNVPYITFLNDGTSKQAPKGFVQAAIKRAVTSARTVKVVFA